MDSPRQRFLHRWLLNWAIFHAVWTLLVGLYWITTRHEMAAGAFLTSGPLMMVLIISALLTRRWRQ